MVAGLLLLWVATMAVAASARLHSAVCHDARESSHECLFTSLAKGHCVEPPGPSVSPASAPSTEGPASGLVSVFVAEAEHRLASSRAPPSSFLPS